jgi:urea transport system ATP-binding protein
MLKVDGLNQYYGSSHILDGVGCEAKQGVVTVVPSRNGVDKTKLLRRLMGVVQDGSDITKATPCDRVCAGIGYVPQGHEIVRRLTVEDT